MRLAVLASGRGSNLGALLAARAAGRLDFTLAGVFSDRPEAPALALAAAASAPALALPPRAHPDRAAHDAALGDAVAAVQPDLIVLAGYMRVLADAFVGRFEGRMLNIHPSLLPKHPGLRTHQRALDAGDAWHGASVHFVVPALDAGPVVAQARIAILPGDDAEALATRLLPREHALLAASVGLFASGRLAQDGAHVRLDGRPLARPLRLGDDDALHPED